MSDYTLYCNTIQTRKAIELGAPIESKSLMGSPNSWTGKAYIIEGNICALPPTAEQMISWLESNPLISEIRIEQNTFKHWFYVIYDEHSNYLPIGVKYSSSRQETTLAAIDAALDYLNKKK